MKKSKINEMVYSIQLERGGSSEMTVLIAAIVLTWAVLYGLVLLMHPSKEASYTVSVIFDEAVAATAGIVLLAERRKKGKEGQYIWVNGETFTIGAIGKERKTYRFSEITEVKITQPYGPNGRGGITGGKICYSIFVGKTCVASMHMKMNNAWRFVEKANETIEKRR